LLIFCHPAQAGIQDYQIVVDSAKASLRAPAFAGTTPMVTFYETVILHMANWCNIGVVLKI